MFAYARAAIDFWPGWLAEEQFLDQLKAIYTSDDAEKATGEYEELKQSAFLLAKKVGWEGDIREGPFVAGLPTDMIANDGKIMIAWKQDNNGDTFVVSPIKLAWLEIGDYGKWVEG